MNPHQAQTLIDSNGALINELRRNTAAHEAEVAALKENTEATNRLHASNEHVTNMLEAVGRTMGRVSTDFVAPLTLALGAAGQDFHRHTEALNGNAEAATTHSTALSECTAALDSHRNSLPDFVEALSIHHRSGMF